MAEQEQKKEEPTLSDEIRKQLEAKALSTMKALISEKCPTEKFDDKKATYYLATASLKSKYNNVEVAIKTVQTGIHALSCNANPPFVYCHIYKTHIQIAPIFQMHILLNIAYSH